MVKAFEYAKNRYDERICRLIFVISEKNPTMLEKNEKRITKIAQNPNVEFVGIPCSGF